MNSTLMPGLIFQRQILITNVFPLLQFAALQGNPLSEQMVAQALNTLDQVWDELFPAEQARIISLLVKRVVVSETDAEIVMRLDGLHTLVDELDDREERTAVNG